MLGAARIDPATGLVDCTTDLTQLRLLNGLPVDRISGKLVVVLNPITVVVRNGLPIDAATGALAVSTAAGVVIKNGGLMLTASGALAVSDSPAQRVVLGGIPMDATGRMAVQGAGTSSVLPPTFISQPAFLATYYTPGDAVTWVQGTTSPPVLVSDSLSVNGTEVWPPGSVGNYSVKPEEIGFSLNLTETATNSAGSANVTVSAPIYGVSKNTDPVLTAPTTVQAGSAVNLTATAGGYTSAPILNITQTFSPSQNFTADNGGNKSNSFVVASLTENATAQLANGAVVQTCITTKTANITITPQDGLYRDDIRVADLAAPIALTQNSEFSRVGSANYALTGAVSGASLGITANLGAGSLLTMTGLNTYTGATSVVKGNLAVSGAGVLGGGNYSGGLTAADVQSAFIFNSSADQRFNNFAAGVSNTNAVLEFSGTGSITVDGNAHGFLGKVFFQQNVSVTGGLTSTSGALGNANFVYISNGTTTVACQDDGFIGTSGAASVGLLANGTLTQNGSGSYRLAFLTMNGGNLASGPGNGGGNGTWRITGLAGAIGNSTISATNVALANPAGNTFQILGTDTVLTVTGGFMSGNLSKTGAGTMLMSGSSSHVSSAVSAGLLVSTNANAIGTGPVSVPAGGTFALAGTTNYSYSNNVTGAGILRKQGTNCITAAVANPGFTGEVVIESGVLALPNAQSASSWLTSGGNVTVNSGAELRVNSYRTGTFVAANRSIILNGNATLGGLSAASSFGALGAAINLAGGMANITSANTGTQGATLSGVISGPGGARFATTNASEKIAVTNNNNYTGDTVISVGAVNVSGGGQLSGTRNITIQSGASLILAAGENNRIQATQPANSTVTINGTLAIEGGAHSLYATNWVMNNGSIAAPAVGDGGFAALWQSVGRTIVANGANNSISGGTRTMGGGAYTLDTPSATDSLVVSGQIISSSVVKTGAGTVSLTGANSYTGNTVTNCGTLRVDGAGVLGAGNYSGALTVASGALFVYNSSSAQRFNVLAAGAGTINLSGSNTVTLFGDQAFNGTLNVQQNVNYSGGGNAPTSGFGRLLNLTVANGTFLIGDGDNAFMGSNPPGNLTIRSGGVVNHSGATVQSLGTVFLDGGTLASGAGASIWGSYQPRREFRVLSNSTISALNVTLAIGSGTVFDVSAGANLLVTGGFSSFAGAGAFNKTGLGTMTLAGNSANTGNSTVTQGSLVVRGSSPNSAYFVAAGASISAGTSTTAQIGNLTLAAFSSTSRIVVQAINPTSVGKLTCATFSTSGTITIDVLGALNAGTYPILVVSSGLPFDQVVGTNTTGRTITFAWVGQTLNMIAS